MSKTFMSFGDIHFPHQNPVSLEIIKRVVRKVHPDLIVTLGDLLDCGQFSVHPPTFGMPKTEYKDDVDQAVEFLDFLQRHCGRLVMVEGNHEYRLDRWAASTEQGRAAYSSLAPRIRLMKDGDGDPRTRCTYVPYGSVSGRYPHYKINSRLVAVHGWSYAIHATKNHLRLSQGMSIIHGHTHRADVSIIQNVWSSGNVIQARSAGCLCKQIPMYGTGRPVEWINAFILGFLGRRSDSLYTIPIMENRCVLPNGEQVEITKEECHAITRRNSDARRAASRKHQEAGCCPDPA